MRTFFGLVLAACTFAVAHAATLPATPATLAAQLAAAKPGDAITVGPGAYALSLRDYARSPGVVIQAAPQAVFTATDLRNVTGLAIAGGQHRNKTDAAGNWGAAIFCHPCAHFTLSGAMLVGPENAAPGQSYVQGDGYGFDAIGGTDVTLIGNNVAGFRVGAVLGGVSGFAITSNRFERQRADGIDFSSSNGLIIGNSCVATRILGGVHPDCIQGWSVIGQTPVHDVKITGNVVNDHVQGISLFDHGTGGFDRIQIEGNDVTTDAGDGITAVACRGCAVKNNQVRGFAGAATHADIHTDKSPGILRCGNTVADSAGKKGIVDPKCATPGTVPGAF